MRALAPILVLVVAACGSPPPPPEPPPPPAPPAEEPRPETPIPAAVHDRESLRTAAWRLAGLAEDEADAVWGEHAERMAEIWAKVEERHLGPMRAWAQEHLPVADPAAPLYYPFGGPDLASALQFFPAASSYVLVGLEPPGRIPDLDGIDAAALGAELGRLRGGLENLAEAGYFVTKRMETDFEASRLEGLLPVLFIFLARADLAPEAAEFIRLEVDGTPVALESATDRTATAVRVRFSDAGGGGPTRSLYYFSRDLSNAGLAAAPAFTAFLRGLDAFNVYMKSASYLLHMDDFTAHKDFLAAHAGTVLQDDSGIPLRDLPPPEWELRLFGTYSQTLPTYRKWFQEDLKAVYESADKPPLPFAIGYHSKIGGSCLIWAERREE